MGPGSATVKRVAIIGKGSLALHACHVVKSIEGWELSKVIANSNEPRWDVRLSDQVMTHWPEVSVSHSGDWRELLAEEYGLIFSVSYDRIIGRSLIDSGTRILNCHLGRLPQYRGMRPINWALKNNESMHGVTIHEVVKQVDAGPLVACVEFPIWPEIDEVRDVWSRALAYGSLLISDTLPKIDHIAAAPQDETKAKIYFSSQSRLLGDRQDWTREGRVAGPKA
jgi:methionyl-tRNA formyltransferase